MTAMVRAALAMFALAGAALPSAAAAPDYMEDAFVVERILDWGTRPDWSPDGTRIAFTEAEFRDTFAWEFDLEQRSLRCLTCWLGMNGVVTRIYYLPDGSFLVLAPANLSSPEMRKRLSKEADHGGQELYWMPATGQHAPQPLGASAFGEIAISRRPTDDGVRLAWGAFEGRTRLIEMATWSRSDDGAELQHRRTIFDSSQRPDTPVGAAETYGFSDDDRSIYFWTLTTKGEGEDRTMDSDMYAIDIASGEVSPMYETPWHTELHLFPGEAYGLEEANRASDPDGAWRGVSSLDPDVVSRIAPRIGKTLTESDAADYAPLGSLKGFDRPFDLFVVPMDDPGNVRQLTDYSRFGAHATQSVPSPDGRRLVFSVMERCSEKFAGESGLYIGEFKAED